MLHYLVRRLLLMIPLLFGITLICFFVVNLAPGNPTELLMDPTVRPEDLERIRANLGLDKPLIVQYFVWLWNLLHGNLGYSFMTHRPVLAEIFDRLPATLLLTLSSMALTLLITIPMGVISAVRKNSWIDQGFTIFSFFGMAFPSFWLALMLMLLFSKQLGWLPSTGMMSPWLRDAAWYLQAWDVAKHMVLPLLTSTILGLAALSRYQRASMLEVLTQDYIRTARAKGLPERKVIFKHALRNALIPTITILGLSLPSLLSGSFIIEWIFAWPGLGWFGVEAIFQRNYPVIMGELFIAAILILLGNLISDICYASVDPRIKLGKSTDAQTA